MPDLPPLVLAVIGTDTGVGKTYVATLLVHGLRKLGRRVWVHKPVACGGWDGTSAEDSRALAALCGDGQPPDTVCPFQFPEACAPHLAAAAAGATLTLAQLLDQFARVRQAADVDLVVEGVGGLLVPLTPRRETVCDFLIAAGLPVLLVTRPNLGTLNHTALTVAHARRCGLSLHGLVVNHHVATPDTLAVRTAATELAAITGVPVLAEIPFGGEPDPGRFATTILAGRR
jgi:dethiobiotin synthetase